MTGLTGAVSGRKHHGRMGVGCMLLVIRALVDMAVGTSARAAQGMVQIRAALQRTVGVMTGIATGCRMHLAAAYKRCGGGAMAAQAAAGGLNIAMVGHIRMVVLEDRDRMTLRTVGRGAYRVVG